MPCGKHPAKDLAQSVAPLLDQPLTSYTGERFYRHSSSGCYCYHAARVQFDRCDVTQSASSNPLLWWFLVAACGGLFGSACSEQAERPNVLLISVDTLRADRIGAYGYRLDTTPHIDALAAGGAQFTDCTVAWPKTWPSIATLLTGLYPQRTGVTQVRQHLAPELTTLAEIFAEAGYATAAVVANFNIGTVFGFDQGYARFVESWQARWGELQGAASFGRQHAIDVKDYTNATIVTDDALQLLDHSGTDSPFFLWLHYIDPHGPYLPPERYQEFFGADHAPAPAPAAAVLPRYQLQHDRESGAPITDLAHYRAQYDREIRYLDDEIGRLFAGLERRRLDKNTLVVLVADHGESLGEHGYYLEHGKLSYQVNAHVPLIVSQPGVISASRIDWPVGVIDVAPTLLELAGLAIPAALEGTSLAGLIRGESDARGPEHVFMGSGYQPARPQLTIRSGSWKLIDVGALADRLAMTGSRFELYDLSTDPDELHNLAAENPERVERLGDVLTRWYGDGFPHRPQPSAPLKPQEQQMLRQLGYLGEES